MFLSLSFCPLPLSKNKKIKPLKWGGDHDLEPFIMQTINLYFIKDFFLGFILFFCLEHISLFSFCLFFLLVSLH